jgi:hypothetical protein
MITMKNLLAGERRKRRVSVEIRDAADAANVLCNLQRKNGTVCL